MRGISENIDNINMVPHLLLMNCGKCSNLHDWRHDMPYPCSVLATVAWLHLRCLFLLLTFLSGSGDLSDTQA